MRFLAPLLILTALFGLSTAANADVKGITIRVEQEAKETAVAKTYTYTQKRTLKVFVTNGTRDEANVKIKYTFFGHAITDHEITILNQGEMPATIKASATQQVDTPAANTLYILEHYVKGQKAKVPATGNKLVGYGVQLLVDDKVVAEFYEPASMKENIGKATVAKPTATPKKG